MLNVTAAIGGVVAGYVAELYGRKRAIALANLLFLVGSFVIAGAVGFWMLFWGRVLQGLAVGFALVVAPIFTAELVPASKRGMLVAFSDVSTNLGILLGYSAGLVFLDTPSGWRYMFAVGALPAFFLIMLIWVVPESPRWLVGIGRHVSARRALNELYSDSLAADRHFDEMRRMADEHAESEHSGSWRQVFWHEDAVLRKMIWRGLAIAFFSQAMGTEAVVRARPHEATACFAWPWLPWRWCRDQKGSCAVAAIRALERAAACSTCAVAICGLPMLPSAWPSPCSAPLRSARVPALPCPPPAAR